MKPLTIGLVVIALTASTCVDTSSTNAQDSCVAQQQPASIPMDQLGVVTGKQYQGDGLSVTATPDGVRLRCAFQRLEGKANTEGLWLRSTADGSSGERFRVVAVKVARDTPCAPFADWLRAEWLFHDVALLSTGVVNAADNLARFIRPGLRKNTP